VRPFYWSLKREVWENRSIYIAPIAVAAIMFVSALINLVSIPDGTIPFHRLLEVSPHYFRIASISLYSVIVVILGITAGIVGWFYCLDALYGERRERSVLFWKSLPVSDTTAVLSKVLTGMVVVPLIALVVGIALYLVLMLLASIVLMANGVNGALLFANSAFGELLVVNVYVATVAILWSAPLYAWAMFVSSWVRRATFLWALLPPAAIGLAEGLAFNTQRFTAMIGKRLSGGIEYAFVESAHAIDTKEFRLQPENFPDSLLSLLDPARFLSQPGLWIGLVIAAAFIAASIWMRRYREPL
jgi:ABC-2 type transport system permease protein